LLSNKTAGLQAPSTERNDDGIDGGNDDDDEGNDRLSSFSALFVFFFTGIGVPVFLLSVAQGGLLLVERITVKRDEKLLKRFITKAEFDSVKSLDGEAEAANYSEDDATVRRSLLMLALLAVVEIFFEHCH
jgi:hypothetical protein